MLSDDESACNASVEYNNHNNKYKANHIYIPNGHFPAGITSSPFL